MIERPVEDHNLQIFWTGYGQEYMVVQEYGSQDLLMSTWSGYVSLRLSRCQVLMLEQFHKANRVEQRGNVARTTYHPTRPSAPRST
jgi:hypothetical protein